ncbi:MAG: ROK family protein [Phycisphaerae bacterium]
MMKEFLEDISLKKGYNRSLILNSVRKYEPVSRTRIKEVSGIRLASITELVKELSEKGFLREVGVGDSERGRKQVLLELNSRNGFVIGVEFDADHVIGVAADLKAGILARRQIHFPDHRREAIIAGIIRIIGEVIENSGVPREKLMGIGIADPGIVDSRRGVSVFSTTIRDWHEVPLKEIMEAEFKLPVFLEESTRSKTLCEQRYGAGKNIDHLMFIEFGKGIGCGMILNGELFRGFSESAGELGHMRVIENGPVCNCGAFGCLEAVSSLPAIGVRAVKMIKEGANSAILDYAGGEVDKIAAEHVFQAARKGDKLALGIIDEVVKYLGIGIANAVNFFNPQMVIFDAAIGQVEDLILEPVKKMIKRQALDISTRQLEFEVSRMGEETGALGAATLVLDKFFEIPQLKIPDYL